MKSYYGGEDIDMLCGAYIPGVNPGSGEIDSIIGSADIESFILGSQDNAQAFYTTNGELDYGLITGSTTDHVIYLEGNVEDYTLQITFGQGSSFLADTSSYFEDYDTIATLHDLTGLDLNSSSFYTLG